MNDAPSVPVYRHSGKVPPAAWFGGLICSLFVAAAVGAALGFAEIFLHPLPLPKIRLLLLLVVLIAAGFALGRVPTLVFMRMKARSNRSAALLGALSGMAGLYAGWITWLLLYFATSGQNAISLSDVILPGSLWNQIWSLRNPWHAFGDDSGNLVPPLVFWIAEAFILLLSSAATARTTMASGVFCERCARWGVKQELMQIACENVEAMRTALAGNNLQPLLLANAHQPSDQSWCSVILRGCPDCDTLQLLTVTCTTTLPAKDGTANTEKETLIRNLQLAPEQIAAVIEAAAGHSSAAA